ncbi:hypothetical protein [Cellulomonas oligotrophica]|uniref:Uncharacterized protein n=2 Tax=Cellulomonas oligotrophica TaxID=931536 RepID=A0A7Y9FIM9_9CELL|nr:hypothetical protein [Cellulomonas oligotrophica]NYD88076.1 hypothetical protein [Cellulomonas oligotrophica]GIG33583.1 hypothetical protein Col01nite_27420 [Cellulomonas oligotrophica]
MLDAVMSPARAARYFTFDGHWGPGEELAAMRNGSGDEWSIVFSAAGALVLGFDHESEMSPAVTGHLWPGLVEEVPEAFARHLDEPSFGLDGTLLATVCLWRRADDTRWCSGEITYPPEADGDPDGATFLFEVLLDETPGTYQEFSEEYYEKTVDTGAVQAVLTLEPMTADLALRLNPDVDLGALGRDAADPGWPSVGFPPAEATALAPR